MACHADRSKERVEDILAPPGVDVDPVPLGQVGPVVPEEEEDCVAELFRRRGGGEPVMVAGERPMLLLESLLEKTAVFVLLDDEHPLPGIVLPEEQVEGEPDRREQEENDQPGRRRRRVSPLEEDDRDGKHDVERQDDPPYQEQQFHSRDPPSRSRAFPSISRSIYVPAGRSPPVSHTFFSSEGYRGTHA